jgi:hypothetical protein
MRRMDYFIFILIILVLCGIIYILNRFEKRIKTRFKKTAYGLLEDSNPDPKVVRETIRGLRIYGGRWFKDKECTQLVDRLVVKYNSLEDKTIRSG